LAPLLAPASSLARPGKASSARLNARQLALRIGVKIIDFLRYSSFASCLYRKKILIGTYMNRFIVFFCLFLHSVAQADTICSPRECYTVIKKLGEGAYGEVFAVENSQGEPLAIKCYKIHEDNVLAKNRYTDVEREYSRGRVLDHPNIIKSYDLFSDQGTNYLVLELVDGKTLHKTRRGDIPRQESLEAAVHFCQAVNYALSLGFFHLDLHEGNAMFSHDSDIKIIDLASFFSLNELFHHVVEAPEEEASEAAPATSYSDENSTRREKLQAFFLKNPLLFKQLKELSKKKRWQCRADVQSSRDSISLEVSDELHIQNIISAHYFGLFSEFLQKIIEKSDFSREERLTLCLEIKKLAWNYSEDVKTLHDAPFETYFLELMDCLDTFDEAD
jgi:serine/threonine protein kinase